MHRLIAHTSALATASGTETPVTAPPASQNYQSPVVRPHGLPVAPQTWYDEHLHLHNISDLQEFAKKRSEKEKKEILRRLELIRWG